MPTKKGALRDIVIRVIELDGIRDSDDTALALIHFPKVIATSAHFILLLRVNALQIHYGLQKINYIVKNGVQLGVGVMSFRERLHLPAGKRE